jgi:hypothetical protein
MVAAWLLLVEHQCAIAAAISRNMYTTHNTVIQLLQFGDKGFAERNTNAECAAPAILPLSFSPTM